jgi:hypothetical protein
MKNQLKLALCSGLLLTSSLSMAQAAPETLAADKRVITMSPVTSKGYMIYNLGLNVILKKVDLSQLPPMPDGPDLSGIQDFLDSYEVANVVTPGKPAYNGKVIFDIVSTESGKGVGHYEFEQTYKSGTVTLRVIATPLPGIPAAPEFVEALQYITEMAQ